MGVIANDPSTVIRKQTTPKFNFDFDTQGVCKRLLEDDEIKNDEYNLFCTHDKEGNISNVNEEILSIFSSYYETFNANDKKYSSDMYK